MQGLGYRWLSPAVYDTRKAPDPEHLSDLSRHLARSKVTVSKPLHHDIRRLRTKDCLLSAKGGHLALKIWFSHVYQKDVSAVIIV